jgi:hypothetical protein
MISASLQRALMGSTVQSILAGWLAESFALGDFFLVRLATIACLHCIECRVVGRLSLCLRASLRLALVVILTCSAGAQSSYIEQYPLKSTHLGTYPINEEAKP